MLNMLVQSSASKVQLIPHITRTRGMLMRPDAGVLKVWYIHADVSGLTSLIEHMQTREYESMRFAPNADCFRHVSG